MPNAPYENSFMEFSFKSGEREYFQTDKLGMRVYIRIVMIMVLEKGSLPHKKIWLLRARRSCNEKFISTSRPLLMGRLTTRLIT
jgi:hypothetical protein